MINRLLGIVYILMKRGTVTAKELTERYEVSTRTIYRDIETLSMAGIPVYMKKGKNGGISLTEEFYRCVINMTYWCHIKYAKVILKISEKHDIT